MGCIKHSQFCPDNNTPEKTIRNMEAVEACYKSIGLNKSKKNNRGGTRKWK